MSDAAPLDDAALPTRDAAPSTDAGGCLASLSAAERTDRFVGDSQERRDMERVNTALMSCAGGEGCAGATIDVGLDERVVRVRASGETEQTCAERALSGMCLPSLGGMLGREVSVCLP